jgi:hypothetical protein
MANPCEADGCYPSAQDVADDAGVAAGSRIVGEEVWMVPEAGVEEERRGKGSSREKRCPEKR